MTSLGFRRPVPGSPPLRLGVYWPAAGLLGGHAGALPPVEVHASAVAVDVSPVEVHLSAVAVDVSPMAVDVSPVEMHLCAVEVDVSPMAVDVSPVEG
jgi:hypothetical protein